MASRKRSGAAIPASPLLELLERVAGKESSLSLDLDNVGVDLGEGRRVVLNGKVHVNVAALK
ncbi:MAG: hypothetical protein QXO51_05430 [Halobacteria archaeon]